MADTDVLVVGASAAGLGVVESLRRGGYAGRITVLGAEVHVPYDRPPLSKQVLSGQWEPEQAHLRPQDLLDALDAEFILGEPATALDVGTRTVSTATRTLTADQIVIATGSTARPLPGQPELTGLHTFRTLDDALALRADLLAARRLVVVGEGVLGCEIAATATGLGLEVTMTGPQQLPMGLQLGTFVGGLLGRLHQEAGVRLRLGEGVSGFTEVGGKVSGVSLVGGDTLPADVVVVAVGARPATDWLADSGLELSDGVVCDEFCRAAPGIYAVGDVARWSHAGLGRSLRLENRTNAVEQSAAVAEAILGAPVRYAPVPYFWTDQLGAKIQVHGSISAEAQATVVDGDVEDRRFVVRYQVGDDVTAVLGWNMPKQSRLRRQEITTSALTEGATVA
ncbi:MAG: NAD(P)/FAD-dependent oxidoreductase [Marmoricola sp.]